MKNEMLKYLTSSALQSWGEVCVGVAVPSAGGVGVAVKMEDISALGVKLFTIENKLKGDGVMNPSRVSAEVGLE